MGRGLECKYTFFSDMTLYEARILIFSPCSFGNFIFNGYLCITLYVMTL